MELKISLKDFILFASITFSAVSGYLQHLQYAAKLQSIKEELIFKLTKLEGDVLNTKNIISQKLKVLKSVDSPSLIQKTSSPNLDSAATFSYHVDVGVIIKYIVVAGVVICVVYYSYAFFKPIFASFSYLSGSFASAQKNIKDVSSSVVDSVQNTGEVINRASETVVSDLTTLRNNVVGSIGLDNNTITTTSTTTSADSSSSITFSNTPSIDVTTFTSTTVPSIDLTSVTTTTTTIDLNNVEINYVLPSDSVANSSIPFYSMDAETVSELVKDLFT